MNHRALLAEFIGTFSLIFFGVGAAVSVFSSGQSGSAIITIALAHGLAIAILGTCTGAISGGHLNPAVSLGLFLAGKITMPTMIGYWIAQIVGGIAASFALVGIIGKTTMDLVSHGVPELKDTMPIGSGIALEAVLTFFLVLAVFMTAVHEGAPKMGAWFIGMAVTMGILAGAPFTGGCMNPARYLGPAVAGGGFGDIMIYIVGPLAGAVLAAIVFSVLSPKATPAAESA